MEDALRRRLRTSRLSPGQEALLSLLVAAGHIRERLDQVCGTVGLTSAQCNVLRILHGGPPEGYPRCEIAVRMIDRAPDVTRLIDRLEEEGLVQRRRSTADRRLSLAQITAKGTAVVERVWPEIERVNRELGATLGAADARSLSRICGRIYEPPAP